VAIGIPKWLRIGRRRVEPVRDTQPWPTLFNIGQARPAQKTVWKPIPRNLRHFSRTPYARRAINAIKNPIAMLEWEIVPAPGVTETPELKRQIELATYCLQNPNRDDSWRSLVEQVIEDVLVGAGAIETQMSGDALRPLWLWPVDGLSIQIYPAWAGNADEARYTQSTGYQTYTGGSRTIQLRDDELIYIKPNPTSATPFGLGPLEVAFISISRQLGVGEFAGNLSSNARPSILINMGENVEPEVAATYRAYWTNDIEGQGKTPIGAFNKGFEVARLYPEGDTGLFLKYQEFLKSEIATAFDLSPMNLGVERDVNRNTADVSSDRDWDQAIKPRASELASYLTRHALHRRLGFYQLRFNFLGLDIEDTKLNAETYAIEYKAGATTPNEYRETRGRPPLDTPFADMTGVDAEIAAEAARGAAEVLDNNLPKPRQPRPLPKPNKD